MSTLSLGTSKRRTIGFLSTWSVYEGTTIDSYTHTLLQGIYAATREQDCNLLIGCGVSLPGNPRGSRTAWAAPGSGVDFVPVGPWNADGLIIIPDDLSDPQFEYVQDLSRSGYPIVLTTAEKPGPLVAVDNANGIRMAFDHLLRHGHRRIAFIAGKLGRGGDSAERLAAYRLALQEAAIEADERLIAFGEHRREDGATAMQRILDSEAPFTAVLASNDLSALGAMDVLRAAGQRIPDDVAVIGFDDILEARSQLPPLTTVRHPTFMLGYQAVVSLMQEIHEGSNAVTSRRVPTQLVIRQSCGCHAEDTPIVPLDSSSGLDLESVQAVLAHRMADATFIEIRRSPAEEIENLCLRLLRAFTNSLAERQPADFDAEVQQLVAWLEKRSEDAYAWQAAFSTLRRDLLTLLSVAQIPDSGLADTLIDNARLAIAELMQRQATEDLVKHMVASDRLGLMTSQLLAAPEVTECAKILTRHLPQLGIEQALLALYSAQEDDPVSLSTVLLDAGLPATKTGLRFLTRDFPPAALYPSETAYQLAILPILIDENTTGFVALSATNLEPCAAIVHNLASALRTSQLYRDALEGRKQAEEANRLKSRFLSMVSHELRTPLSLIVGLSEMVLQEQREQPRLSSTSLRDLTQVNTSAQHLARLIGDVLDLASSEAGQLRILHEPLDLSEIAQMAARIGEQLARDKGLSWSAEIPGPGLWVQGDRTRLGQVIINLISNAVKFTPQGEVKLEITTTGQQARISVSDTGIGISPAEQKSIFHEFHRSERTIRSGYSGLGLGLAISRQLVERHDGKIGVRSPGYLGGGSTFFFTLPILSTSLPRAELEAALTPANKSVVVLTEPDDPSEQLCDYLVRRGFNIRPLCVEDDGDWLSAVVASSPAALILGTGLAERQGWAILGMLKKHSSTAQIPVLVYSLDSAHDRGELLELNYLQKPLQPEQLAEQLSRYCGLAGEEHTVLVVDDDPAILDLHSRMVKKINCRALTARSGREALNVLENTHPDLILLDLMMPEMDGFAVLDALRQRESTRDIPVIVLTARVLSDADLERCNQSVTTILSKGLFSAAETLDHIESALARQRTLGRATQQLVRQAMAFIHTHYPESLSRKDIAGHVGISDDYLTDCFRKEMNVTPMTYLRRYRIRQARELLENTNITITQVAGKGGFS